MSPTVLAVILVLISALMHASWNLLLKLSGDQLIMAWGIRLGSFVIAVPLVLIDPPPVEVWPFVIASGLLHTLYDLCLVTAYRLGEFSHVYTYARGLSPGLAAVIAFFVLGEKLSGLAVAGLIITILGLLLVSGSLRGFLNVSQRSTFWSLLTAAVIASYSVLDAAGVRIEGNASAYVGAIFIINFLTLTPVAFWRRWGHSGWHQLRDEAGRVVSASVLQITSYALVVFALSVTLVGYITSLRETGVVFAAILGWWFLKEPYGTLRVAGTLAVVVGVVTLSFGAPL